METRKNNDFNRMDYLRTNILAFVQSESKGINQVRGALNALNSPHNIHNNTQANNQKRKILESCLELFKNSRVKELVQIEKEKIGIIDLNTVTRTSRDENLHKMSALANELTDTLAEIILGDSKRKYNMSSIRSDGMVASIKNPDDSVKKAVKYVPEDKMSITLSDLMGDKISVKHIGCLYYKTPFAVEYIYKYRVSRQSTDEEPIINEVFANIDLNTALEDKEYSNALLNTVLSPNNIELSQTGGYIGDLSCTTNSITQLKPGEEYFQEDKQNGKPRMSYYRYQISPKYALEFIDDRIEAVMAYNEQQTQEKTRKDDDGR